MNKEFIRCEYCKIKIPSEPCELAAYRTVIDGKEYVFCCEICFKRYQQKKREKRDSEGK